MSQFLGRVAKLSSQGLCFSELRSFSSQGLCFSELRSFSSQGLCFSELRSFSTAATPYLLFKDSNYRTACGGGEMVVDVNLYDPRKDERVKIPDQTLPKGLELPMRIGSSRGWVGVKNRHDPNMRLTNIFNPCASDSSRKVITLPPLDDSKAHIASISLSASPNQQDCVVAAKSCRSFISLCRPGDSDWTRVEVPFFASRVTYSVIEEKFYLFCRKQDYEGPVDLVKASSGFPQVSLYQSFPYSDIPKNRQDLLISTSKTHYLVQSPAGDSFIVCRCAEFFKTQPSIGKTPPYEKILRQKPRGFLVFRQDPEQRIGSYTEDIGDLCIFLGNNEAFCVSATEYPGLNPNSVYYASWDTGFGCYDLSSNTFLDLIDDETPRSQLGIYMWLAPLQ